MVMIYLFVVIVICRHYVWQAASRQETVVVKVLRVRSFNSLVRTVRKITQALKKYSRDTL